MSLKKMTKEDLELLSNKDITNLILEESKKSINTADLFKKIHQCIPVTVLYVKMYAETGAYSTVRSELL